MPFINEKLAANAKTIAEQTHRAAVKKGEEAALEGGAASPFVSRFVFDPSKVMALLEARIIGQPHVLAAMRDMLQVVKADIGAEDRPLAVNLFLGPTGVGKTETVRVLAEAIYGSPDNVCRIDMNTLAQEHYAAAITGAPPGYVGSKEGQTLFDVEAIQGSFSKPGIVLFDELEKASTEVIRSLLNVLDNGKLVLSSGAKIIDFRNSLIFMTSNIGAADVRDYREQFESGWRSWLGLKPTDEQPVQDAALHKKFDPEFLNRIDHILPFNRLGDQWLEPLLDIELSKLQKRLSKKGITLTLTPEAKAYFCDPTTANYDERFGARDLARRLRKELEPIVAKELMAGNGSGALKVALINQALRLG